MDLTASWLKGQDVYENARCDRKREARKQDIDKRNGREPVARTPCIPRGRMRMTAEQLGKPPLGSAPHVQNQRFSLPYR
jgi:hypothetical protein